MLQEVANNIIMKFLPLVIYLHCIVS